MKPVKKYCATAFFLLVFVPAYLHASDSPVQSGDAVFSQALDMYYNSEFSYEELKPLLLKSAQLTMKEKNGYDKSMKLAWAYYTIGESAVYCCETGDIIPFYDKALEAVNKAILYNVKSAEAKALKGLLYMKLWSAHGGAGSEFGKSHGPDILPLLTEAITLDKNDVHAKMFMAVYLLYTPQQWGGNVDRGVALLRQISADASKTDIFSANCLLADAYKLKNMPDEEQKYYREALKIYPNNVWVNTLIN